MFCARRKRQLQLSSAVKLEHDRLAGPSLVIKRPEDLKLIKQFLLFHLDALRKTPGGIPLDFSECLLTNLVSEPLWQWEFRSWAFRTLESYQYADSDSSCRAGGSEESGGSAPSSAGTESDAGADSSRSAKSPCSTPGSPRTLKDALAVVSEGDSPRSVHSARSSEGGPKSKHAFVGTRLIVSKKNLERTRQIKMQKSKPLDDVAALVPSGTPALTASLNGAFKIELKPDYLDKMESLDRKGRKVVNLRLPSTLMHAVYNLKEAIVRNKVAPEAWTETPMKDLTSLKYKFVNAQGKEAEKRLVDLLADVFSAIQDGGLPYWLDTTVTGFTPTREWSTHVHKRPWIYATMKKARGVAFETVSHYGFLKKHRSLRKVTDTIFTALQVLAVLESGKVDERVHEYGTLSKPPIPSVVFCDLSATSTNYFSKSLNLDLYHTGSAASVSPWGLKLKDESGREIRLRSEDLKDPDRKASIGPDVWDKVSPGSRVRLTVVPESGSAASRFGKSIHVIVFKPHATSVIDFNNDDKFWNPVIFAETFGNESKIHYHYMPPIRVIAQKGHTIVIKNITEKRGYRTYKESIDNLDKFLIENAPNKKHHGWGSLKYFARGRVRSTGHVTNQALWDNDKCKFAIEQVTMDDAIKQKKSMATLGTKSLAVRLRLFQSTAKPAPEPEAPIPTVAALSPKGKGKGRGKGGKDLDVSDLNPRAIATLNNAYKFGPEAPLFLEAQQLKGKSLVTRSSANSPQASANSPQASVNSPRANEKTETENEREKKTKLDEQRAKMAADAAKISLPYTSENLVFTDKNGKRWINIRWPSALVAAVFNFQQCIVENELTGEQWAESPFKDLSLWFKFQNFMGGYPLQKTLGALFSQCLSSVDENELWWLDTPSVRAFTPSEVQTYKWLLRTWDDFLNVRVGRNDTRNFYARSLNPATDIIFNVLQTIALLVDGTRVDETLWDYQITSVPRMPAALVISMMASSRSQFAADCAITVSHLGACEHVAPWGLTVEAEGMVPMFFSSGELGKPTDFAEINWEHWTKVPVNKFATVTLVPAEGSPWFGNPEVVSLKVMKPLSEYIDFQFEDKFGTEVIFAETLGDESGMHYYFRTPLRVYATRGNVLAVKNITEDKKWIIPQESVNDVDMWLFQNTRDLGNGWGNLHYLGKGDKDPETGKLINVRCWDTLANKFAIEMVPRQKKQAKDEDDEGEEGA